MAAGELVRDKIPGLPDRIEPAPLLARATSGAVSGAALSQAAGEPLAAGAVPGAAAAVLSAFGMYHLRRTLTHRFGLPDLPVALAEDAAALSIGRSQLG
jgi:uncharacterized membrane protein